MAHDPAARKPGTEASEGGPMRTTLMTLGAGTAVLAAGLILPAAADAATITTAGPPAPQNSYFLAGYEQLGCQNQARPVYSEIAGTITVPVATYINGTPGISADIYNIGGTTTGVSAGVAVDNSGGHAFYAPFGQWGNSGGQVTAPFSAQPGDKLEVTIEDEGASGWMVEILDERSGQEWTRFSPDASDQPCQAGAYVESDSPAYDFLTQTSPVAFDFTRVWWEEQNLAGVSNLLGTPPSGATLFRYNLINNSTTVVAATSKPADADNNFTVTDTALLTPNLAGYEVTQPLAIGGGDPYTGVKATWKVPKITKVDPNSYAFAYYLVGIGNAYGSGVMAGIAETMSYGKVSYKAFTQLGASIDYVQGVTVHPGDTIRAVITGSDSQGWHAFVYDLTTRRSGGVINVTANYGQYDAEVAELRPANPIGPGFLPLATTTPVTFDHATFSAGGKTYPFLTSVLGGSVQRLEMLNSSAKTIAATSQPDSDKDGFTVRDGATRPASPKS
jgi:hypothetical protein